MDEIKLTKQNLRDLINEGLTTSICGRILKMSNAKPKIKGYPSFALYINDKMNQVMDTNNPPDKLTIVDGHGVSVNTVYGNVNKFNASINSDECVKVKSLGDGTYRLYRRPRTTKRRAKLK